MRYNEQNGCIHIEENMRIDFHTHAFPDRIAAGAVEKVGFGAGGLRPSTDGTVAGLTASLAELDAKGVLLPVATKPSQQRSINDWVVRQKSDRIIPFGSVYPLAPDAVDELERLYGLGLRGVKLHPEFQSFDVDDPRVRPLYRKIGQLGMIVVFHAGLDMAFLPPCRCAPRMLQRAMDDLAGAQVVAAHWGGYMLGQDVLNDLKPAPNLYLDTAYSYSRVLIPLVRALIDAHGPEHILFGSDTPWSNIRDEARLIESLRLPADWNEAIFFGNAKGLLSSAGAME
jgi:predicted TIM-barrel fold metal-dependent hydrolase